MKLFGWILRIAVLAITVLVVDNCGNSNTSTSPTLTSIYNNVLAPSCVQCHSPGNGGDSNLDFSSQAQAYNTLMGTVSGTSSSSTCGNVPIVSPGNPSGSYLLAVLSSTYWHTNFDKSGCTPYQTHLQNTSLSSDELQAIVSWISSGAPNN